MSKLVVGTFLFSIPNSCLYVLKKQVTFEMHVKNPATLIEMNSGRA